MVRGALDLGSEETEKKQSQSLEATVLLLYSVQYALQLYCALEKKLKFYQLTFRVYII